MGKVNLSNLVSSRSSRTTFLKSRQSSTRHTYDYSHINVQKLTSLNLVIRMTIITPVKPKILKFQVEKILPSELLHVTVALLTSDCKRVKSFV
jgi:hypothetical protein